jgi:5-oxoprolinase (ATP-hydrolysing)
VYILIGGNLEAPQYKQYKSPEEVPFDIVELSIFAHRFMSIAEQMGLTLQKTSVSTNIKERLDFSCALFDPTGSLVANAPHLPVHLGSMQEAVRYQVLKWGSNWKEGDVIVANHP